MITAYVTTLTGRLVVCGDDEGLLFEAFLPKLRSGEFVEVFIPSTGEIWHTNLNVSGR